jgi:hypothetical protein
LHGTVRNRGQADATFREARVQADELGGGHAARAHALECRGLDDTALEAERPEGGGLEDVAHTFTSAPVALRSAWR